MATKVIDVSKLGLKPYKRKKMQYKKTDNGVTGMAGLVAVTVVDMVSTSQLNEEDALAITEAGAEWRETPAALTKPGSACPKWMALFMGRRWFTDNKPVVPEVEQDVVEETPVEVEVEVPTPKRKRGRPAKRKKK